jgi:hypothetical protein
MSNLIIPAAGAVVGYMVGGPTGAQVGWVAGSAYQASKQVLSSGQTIGDLRIQTAAYGVVIPYVVGMQRVTGNIIWAPEKKTYEKKTGGKGGSAAVVTTGYTASMAIAICAGPILGISRMWANGDLLVDGRTSGAKLPGALYLGSMTQTADPTYQTAVGAANAPAYRGLAYMVLTNYDLGTSGVIPQFSFEVVKGATL